MALRRRCALGVVLIVLFVTCVPSSATGLPDPCFAKLSCSDCINAASPENRTLPTSLSACHWCAPQRDGVWGSREPDRNGTCIDAFTPCPAGVEEQRVCPLDMLVLSIVFPLVCGGFVVIGILSTIMRILCPTGKTVIRKQVLRCGCLSRDDGGDRERGQDGLHPSTFMRAPDQ